MSSVIGTLTSVSSEDAVGPVFTDQITMVGDAGYVAGNTPNKGTPNFQAAFQALTGQGRTVFDVSGYVPSAEGYSVRYHAPVFNEDGSVATPDSLEVRLEDQTSGVTAEHTSGNLSALTFNLTVRSN